MSVPYRYCFEFVCASNILVTVAGNRLVWTSWKHGPAGMTQTCKTVFFNKHLVRY